MPTLFGNRVDVKETASNGTKFADDELLQMNFPDDSYIKLYNKQYEFSLLF